MQTNSKRRLGALTILLSSAALVAMTHPGDTGEDKAPRLEADPSPASMMPAFSEEATDADCAGGRSASLQEAALAADFPLFSTTSETLGKIDRITLCEDFVVMTYSSGSRITQQSSRMLSISMEEYVESQLKQAPIGEAAKVRGLPAYVIRTGLDAYRDVRDIENVTYVGDPNGEYGAVSVVDNGTWINLTGNQQIPLPDLVGVVEEMTEVPTRG